MLDHEAIRKAYPEAVIVDDATGVFKEDGTQINILQSEVDAARVILNNEYSANLYKTKRTGSGEKEGTTYESWREQLAMLYDDMIAGKLDTTGTWATHIKAVKDANPKP
tara:strand:+ start:616 stop:942 length:327 start_codon:yes stop_codon:yes gene_type:complete